VLREERISRRRSPIDVKTFSWLRNPALRVALVIALLLVAATAAWRYTPLADWLTAERVVDWVETFSRYWWAPFALALVYTPASLVLFPRPLLTMAAAIAFGPWEGFAVAMAGVMFSTLVGYVVGRRVDSARVKSWGGERMQRVFRALRAEGLVAVATVCVVPLAPFFVEVVAFGALRLKLWHVMLGVFAANVPGLVASTLLGDQVHAILSHDRTLNWWIVGGVVAVLAGGAWATRRLWRRMQSVAGPQDVPMSKGTISG
jgi:phospholipase D1/2